MANEFSGDAGFEWNPKQEKNDMRMFSEIPDGVKSVWRLRYISNNRAFNTYHPNAKDAFMQVRLCVKRGFKVESLHRIKVVAKPVTLGVMIADAEIENPFEECETIAEACEVVKRLDGLSCVVCGVQFNSGDKIVENRVVDFKGERGSIELMHSQCAD